MRKQPRQRRSKVTVDAVLEAAARILEERGLGALNTNLVAERAGVSIGSLYQFFPTKKAIVAELARRERAKLTEAIQHVETAAPDMAWAAVQQALIDAAVDHQLGRPRLARALEYAEAVMGATDVSETREASDAPKSLEAFNGDVAAAVARMLVLKGQVSSQQSMLAAHDLVAITRGMADAAGMRGEEDKASLSQRIGWAVSGYLAQ